MSRNYVMGGPPPRPGFPFVRFTAVVVLVLSLTGIAGWFLMTRQPPEAEIRNAPPVTRKVTDSGVLH